ncbi:PadR family transcriptional regulator [Actinoplanes sp. NPDC051346]|uniref:PadR family transcriptional regulator n=1 Tax=Actinoplanes sp. NPDC051346 TaxID=3155048 RepID=UPI0034482AF9
MAATDPMSGWLRGALELAVLAVLAEEDRHGYALAHRLAEEGLGAVRGGALYPVLGKLEASGAVRATWQPGEGGPGRKVYAITADGRDRLVAERVRWHEFATAFARLLDADHAPDTHPGEAQP